MPEILLLGLNHKTAPVEVRECLAFSPDEAGKAISALQEHPSVDEVLLFSTCNRIEILLVAKDKENAVQAAKGHMAGVKNVPLADFEDSLYLHEGDNAVRHIFRVASSLDSMMVGEPQILGQIKEAYKNASVKKSSGVILNRLMHRAFFVAKRVRTETAIGDNAVSISYAAIQLGRKIFGTLEDKNAMLIGAGEMAELAVEHLIRHRVSDIFVANRTFEHGVKLADRYRGNAIRFEEIPLHLQHVDIIISSTGSPDFVINRRDVKSVMRKRRLRPLFFIDIAVPRDIDPAINRIENAYVYDIDDLKGVIDDNIEDRQKEAVKAGRIIDEAVIKFRQWYESLDVVPTIIALRKKMEHVASEELKKTLHSMEDLSQSDNRSICKMVNSIINKLLHDPTQYLKNDGCQGDRSIPLDITRKLFKLDP